MELESRCTYLFYDRSEYCYEDEYSFDSFKNNTEKLFKWLLIKSREYNFTPVLEFDALNKYITGSKFLEELLEKYNEIKLCLDTGRLHAQHINDKDFNEIDIIKRFSKYTKVIHLWNVQVEGGSDSSHYPALPTLREEDGWAPIEKYLNIIKEENRDIIVLFEHRSEKVNDEEIYVVIKGNGEFIVDGERVPVKEGSVIRIGTKAKRRWRNNSDRDLVVMVIQGKERALVNYNVSDGYM